MKLSDDGKTFASTDDASIQRLERLAKSVDCSKSYLAAEAIEEYLDIHEWQVQAIQEGLEKIEQGAVIDFAEVKKQFGFSD